MLDLSQLYLIDLENDKGEIEKTPCRIISYNENTEKYTISARGVGDTIITTAGKLYAQDPTVVSGTLDIGNDGNYNIETYAEVEVNVNSETSPLVLSTYSNDIDTTHYASVDASGLEPTGSLVITSDGTDIDVKTKATVTVNVNNESNPKDIVENGNNIDTTHYSSVNVNVPQPTPGTYTYTSNGDYTDIFTGVTVHVEVPQPTLNVVTLDPNSDMSGYFIEDNQDRAYGVNGTSFDLYSTFVPENYSGYSFVGWSTTLQQSISELPNVYYTENGSTDPSVTTGALNYSRLIPENNATLYAVFSEE